ncbi:MAG: TetR/AcrR family transcriptional regulator [Acidobacteria bacterium]|nr:TetR/AcrR family transcriptional regulator [Acidobacteriota bacterium]
MATAPARLTAADRREQILMQATNLFARQGYKGTTTKEIALRAGITEALIFRHFASKEELYWAVIEAKIDANSPKERMRARLRVKGSDAAILGGLAEDILERRAKDQDLSRLLLYSALENHRLSQRFFRAFVSSYYGLLAEYIARRTREGVFRPVDPTLAARAFLGMIIYHSWVQELFGGKRYQRLSVQQVSRTLVDVWLKGMLAEPARRNGNRLSTHGRFPGQELKRGRF